jgi:predicted amidohydrolase YtcJ
MDDIATIEQMVEAIRRRAATTPEREWVMTSMSWHESDLAERRVPTIDELDAATATRPVLARRGGHLAIANTAALRRAGDDAATSWPGGNIGRNADGTPNGLLEGSAVYRVMAYAPPPSDDDVVKALAHASATYASLGVGTIREA